MTDYADVGFAVAKNGCRSCRSHCFFKVTVIFLFVARVDSLGHNIRRFARTPRFNLYML